MQPTSKQQLFTTNPPQNYTFTEILNRFVINLTILPCMAIRSILTNCCLEITEDFKLRIPKSIDQSIRLKIIMALHELNCVQVSLLMDVTHQKIRHWTSPKGKFQPEDWQLDDLETTLAELKEVA